MAAPSAKGVSATLSTSATENYKKIARNYLLIAAFCAVFALVYEYFSFGVYSGNMIFAFAYPLLGGSLPALLIHLLKAAVPSQTVRWVYRCGIATLTVGSIIQGVLDIYGTTNALTLWYPVVGWAMAAGAVAAYLLRKKLS